MWRRTHSKENVPDFNSLGIRDGHARKGQGASVRVLPKVETVVREGA